jgi:ferredoxin hydrogenase small subunit
MTQNHSLSRRDFIKAAGVAGTAATLAVSGFSLVGEAEAAAIDFVAKRQSSVYDTDANKKVYAVRKSQDNPMVQKLYAKGGFLSEGPCGHTSHELLHTRYFDRSASIKELKAKGVKLKV